MEDTYKVENGGRFVAVFDGHGGAEVSMILQERLHELYSEELVKKHWEQQNDFGVERKEVPSKSSHIAALQRGLETVEEAIMKLDDLVYQGSTAVCTVLHAAKDGRRTLLTANVGDSRSILCRDGKAVDMTRDHKPGDERERERIQAMGEEVEWDPYGQVYRVRDLSLSRAIGDRFAKPVVTSEAEIMTFPIVEGDDQFVVLASDGLWDVMTSQEVVDYVQEVLNSESKEFSQLDKRKEMAKIVASEALERGSADNVCVLVLWLQNSD
jgi:serine/threonine protein phosphatase PrpC